MRGYYGYPAWIGQAPAQQSGAEIFKRIQAALPTQTSAVIQPLVQQFNQARDAERPDYDMAQKRRWVLWYGQSFQPHPQPGYDPNPGSALRPIGVFQNYDSDGLQALLELAFQPAKPMNPWAFFALGLENDPIPLAILA